jgi:glucose-1-phosphate cytidylyltransferase
MKVVILAGGFGTRISEESVLKPKPMVEICGKPILWHIMKYYSSFGFNDFVICCGYKQYVIKEWFADYYLHTSDVTFDFTAENKMIVHSTHTEPWKVTLVDTGLNTMTGGRIKRIKKFTDGEPFMLTYGDGVCNVNIDELLKFHKEHGKIATITSVNVGQQFGCLDLTSDGSVTKFREKSDSDGAMINAGYMVMNPEIFDYIEDDSTIFEKKPLERLASEGQLKAFVHNGFWKCMDTKRDKEKLESLIESGEAPWIVWEE